MMLSHNAEVWELLHTLFVQRTPVFLRDLPHEQQVLIPALGSGIVHSSASDIQTALCPFCQQHVGKVIVIAGDPVELACRCPDCGQIELENADFARVTLDPLWFARQLRGAMAIQSHDQPQQFATDVWRIGEHKRTPVVLARSVRALMMAPELIDRLQTKASQTIQVIAPRHEPSDALAMRLGITWLRLQERFAWYGNKISFDAPVEALSKAGPPTATHGPFSEDFSWVHLPGAAQGPVALTQAQSAVFRALHQATRTLHADELMQRAGLASQKPGDVFKVKTKHKGDPRYEAPMAAFRNLVLFNRGDGYKLKINAEDKHVPA
jgi:hypothetical protein